MKLRLPLLAALPCLALAGCGDDHGDDHGDHPDANIDCSMETRATPYMAGMIEQGDTVKVALVSSDPAPPGRGDNAWTIQVMDADDQPLDGLTITMDSNVDVFMVDHGHGTPKQPVITPVGSNGEYTLDPINLWMPGYWEVTPHISDGADLDDEVTFKICIDD
jgi:hypothetical protein